MTSHNGPGGGKRSLEWPLENVHSLVLLLLSGSETRTSIELEEDDITVLHSVVLALLPVIIVGTNKQKTPN